MSQAVADAPRSTRAMSYFGSDNNVMYTTTPNSAVPTYEKARRAFELGLLLSLMMLDIAGLSAELMHITMQGWGASQTTCWISTYL